MADWYEAQIDRLGEAVENVRALHTNVNPDGTNANLCLHCSWRTYPCPTILAIEEANG